ncbi:protein kinase, putative [Bodo saltans]|uniref:Protein kinase, putative n=1 Tax=Bodo saltans TaxID=75058 RepID=A0A0S4JPZ7_BODSA|nr:protein kinase, putative [Bodo saltans]|eukprot:CUG92252.1 protein kinase, putative [Bodo saltans]
MSLLPFIIVDSIRTLYDVDEIYDFINSGTYASVYRAVRRDTPQSPFIQGASVAPGSVVALKVIQKNGIKTEKDARDIINEVAILKYAQHPNIVRLAEVFQTTREVCIALEFVEGKELLQGLGVSRAITEVRARNLIRQIISALMYLHEEKRVVHRDLKPENILVTADDHIVIVDFGLAKVFGHTRHRPHARLSLRPSFHQAPPDLARPSEAQGHLIRSASIESVDSVASHTDSPILATPCGTLKYAAPEAVRTMASHGAQWSTTRGSMPKLDMYSCGIIGYIMLCGQLPYETSNKATLAAQMERGASFQSPRWATRSEDAKNFVALLLQPDPSLRMGASDALQHPWIRPCDDEGSPCGLTTTMVTSPNSLKDDEESATKSGREALSMAFQAMMPSCSGQPDVNADVNGMQRPVKSVSYF